MWLVENEGAKFGLSVLTELKHRWLQDILIADVDGLKSIPDSINSVTCGLTSSCFPADWSRQCYFSGTVTLILPRNVDPLSEVVVFKLFRTETATGTVTSSAIVVTLDIIKRRRPHYFPTGKAFSVDTFHLQ